jgi:hypothetical protein
MKHLFAILLVGIFSCSGQEPLTDGSVESMEAMAMALEAEAAGSSYSYKDEELVDCHGGGNVLIKVNWTFKEQPYSNKYYVSWEYDACVTKKYGTIAGKVTYSRNNEEMPDFWFTGVNYFADLDYSGSAESECDSYMVMSTKTQKRARDLRIKEHCSHPVSHWWGYLD